MLTLALALLVATPPPPPARAVVQDTSHTLTYNGVTLPRRISVEGHDLVLNGAGLRKKFIVKVYVGALYLPAPSADAEAILAANAPRRMVLQFLYGVGPEKMCEAWDEALEKNTPGAGPELTEQFRTLCGWMEKIEKTEQFVFTYLPGTGTTVDVKGVTKGTIPGKAFADALFKAWLGPKPGPGDGFKKNLLGGVR